MHKVLLGVVCGLLVAGGVTAGVRSGNHVAAAQSDVPAAQHDRIGLYHWSSNTVAKPAGIDRLTWGTDTAARLGTRTVRIALTAADSYQVNNAATTLTAIAQQPAYRTVFSDSRLSTYFLTVYSAGDLQGSWSDGFSAAEGQATHDETAALARYLLQTYQGKKFVFLNWEGDNALQAFPSTNTTAWSGYTDWIKARVSGVADARKAVTSTSQVYSGLEFNAVKRLDTGAACNATDNKCVISYVAPKVEADFYSYSAWQSQDPSTVGTDAVAARLSADLSTAYNAVVGARPAITHANFVVGEFGTARDVMGECVAAVRIQKTIEAIEAWGASYGIAWQTMDNDPASGELFLGYGAYKRDGSPSLGGQTLANLYATGTATAPSGVCAAINNGGVVNGQTFKPVIHRHDVISIFGANFSKTGNVVWIKQNGKFTAIRAGGSWWYESPTQINAVLPDAVVAGNNVTVSVTGFDGRDSNSQVITVLS